MYSYFFIFVYDRPLEGIWLAGFVLTVLTAMSFSAYQSYRNARSVYRVAYDMLYDESEKKLDKGDRTSPDSESDRSHTLANGGNREGTAK